MEIHNKLLPLYGGFGPLGVPLLTVFSSPAYYWGILGIANLEPELPVTLDDEAFTRFKSEMRDCFALSTIGVPRWAVWHLRVAGSVLAHEHFHRLVYLAYRALQIFSSVPASFATLERHFGYPIQSLALAFHELYQALTMFAPDLPRSCRVSITNELLCDAAGPLLVGPAFSFSLPVILLPFVAGDPGKTLESHPLPSVRLRLQRCILDHLGFVDAAKTLDDLSDPMLQFVRSEAYEAVHGSFVRRFEEWITRDDIADLFKRIVELIALLIDNPESLPPEPVVPSYAYVGGNEAAWQQKLDHFIDKLEDGQFHYGLDGLLNPTDVLNSIWAAKSKRFSDSTPDTSTGLQLAWRIWLATFKDKWYWRNPVAP